MHVYVQYGILVFVHSSILSLEQYYVNIFRNYRWYILYKPVKKTFLGHAEKIIAKRSNVINIWFHFQLGAIFGEDELVIMIYKKKMNEIYTGNACLCFKKFPLFNWIKKIICMYMTLYINQLYRNGKDRSKTCFHKMLHTPYNCLLRPWITIFS